MKKAFSILLIGFISINYSQVNRYSNYTPSANYQAESFSDMFYVALAMKQKHDTNLEYLFSLKDWIIELKTKIKDEKYLKRLDLVYNTLSEYQKGALANVYPQLKEVELYVKDKIINEYNESLKTKTTNSDLYQSALTKIENKDYNDAYADLNSVIQNNPNNLNAHFVRAKINLYNFKNYDAAIQEFTALIQMKPEVSEAYLQRGTAYNRKKDYSNAIADYYKYLEANPDDTNVLFFRALAKANLEDNAGAISDYDKIISLQNTIQNRNYKMSTVLNNKAYCLVGLGNNKEALIYVNKALELDKSEAYIWDTRGEISYNLGQYQNSINDMDKAIEIQKNGNSYYYKGLSQIKLNQKTKGCENLSKAGELGKTEAYQKIKENCK